MGCSCTKNSTEKVVSGNKLSDVRSLYVQVGKKKSEEVKTTKGSIKAKRNLFFSIQKKSWIFILDFLTYKEVTVAGCINKALNKIARSQNILKKFYKNRKNSISLPSDVPGHKLDYSQYATITNNFTTINNYNLNKTEESKDKNVKCLISLPTLTVEYDNQSEMKGSFSSQSRSNKIEATHPSKMVKIQVGSPYVDIFSNKEIELKLESGFRSLEDSESGDMSSQTKRKWSVENHSEKTPSFNQDLNDDIVEIISITNITQVNIPKKRNSNSLHKNKNSTLTIPRNLSVRVRSAEKRLNTIKPE